MSTALAYPVRSQRVRASAIGAVAQAALAKCDGWVQPIAEFPDAPYLRAGDTVVWIGVQARSMHPRMIVLDAPPERDLTLRIDAAALTPWQPAPVATSQRARAHLVHRAALLQARACEIDTPRGFGALLVGTTPAFPLDLARPRVDRFMEALGTGHERAIEECARALLGVGNGLTPSGDDFVGAALFARRLVMPDAQQEPFVQRMIAHAHERTHVISAALFTDLVTGASYGLLHDVITALASTAPIDAAIAPAQKLVVIGHSSGWDMLTGLLMSFAQSAGSTSPFDRGRSP